MSNYDAFCEYEEEMSQQAMRGNDVNHIVCRNSDGRRDYGMELVRNSYRGELLLSEEDFAND